MLALLLFTFAGSVISAIFMKVSGRSRCCGHSTHREARVGSMPLGFPSAHGQRGTAHGCRCCVSCPSKVLIRRAGVRGHTRSLLDE